MLGELATFRRHSEGVELFALAIQGWAHVQSRPEAKAVVLESFARLLKAYRDAAAEWTTDDTADATAIAIAGAVIGFIVQGAMFGTDGDVDLYCAGLESIGRLPWVSSR